MMTPIILEIQPMPAPRLNAKSRFSPTKAPIFQRYMRWKRDVAFLARAAGWHPTDEFHVLFVIAMPKSWSHTKRHQLCGAPHQGRPDRNNLMKALEDALYPEDSQVWKSSEEKRWGETGKIIISPQKILDNHAALCDTVRHE